MHTTLSSLATVDVFSIFLPYWPFFVLFAILFVIKQACSLPQVKGWIGEKQVQWLGLKQLDKESYTVIHDLYIPRPDGKGTTQLDHVVVSRFGIFVIETKNYDHWIFGSAKQKQWTQKIFKKSYKFQNPLHQNDLHLNALEKFLNIEKSNFHSIVFFIGSCTFKTEMPSNVMNKGLLSYIKSFQQELLSPDLVHSINKTLLQHDKSMAKKRVAKQHRQSLKARR